jgi:serine phosphatase RsbU (regulator of sigma subunit)/Tfp pilus assembly protein PilF
MLPRRLVQTLLTVILFLMAIAIHAQSSKAKSLLNELHSAKDDTNKVKLLNELGRLDGWVVGDFNKAIDYGLRAKQLSQKLRFTKGITDACGTIGIGYFYQGNFSGAIAIFNEALKVCQDANDSSGVAESHGYLANVYKVQGNYTEALKNYQACLAIMRKTNDKLGMAHTLNNIGSLFEAQGNYPEALKSYFSSLRLKEEKLDTHGIMISYHNIGIIYRKQGDFSKALKNYKLSLKIAEEINDKQSIANIYSARGLIFFEMAAKEVKRSIREQLYNDAFESFTASFRIFNEIGNKNGIADAYSNLGCLYVDQANDDLYRDSTVQLNQKALGYFFNSLKIKEEIGNQPGIASACLNIGKVYSAMRQHQEGKKWLERSLELARELNSFEALSASFSGLTDVYSDLGQYRKALESYKKHISYRDSLINESNTKKLVEQQMLYEFDKKEAIAKAEQEKKDAIAREEVNKQTMQRNGFIVGFILMIALAGLSYRSYRIKAKANEVIGKQKAEVEKQKHIVEEKQKEILDSINYAKRIQEAILPSRESLKANLKKGFVLYKPKDVVSGDFYWLEKQNGRIYLAAADCTGHGVPGALVSVVCANALSKALLEERILEPGKILDRTRDLVIEQFAKSGEDVKDGMDISLVSLNYEQTPEKVNLQWAGANNPLWIIRKNYKENVSTEFELIEIKPDKQPIGKYADHKPFSTHQIELCKGDSFYIFTDGFADQFGGSDGKKFKISNFKKLLLSVQHVDMNRQKDLINEAFESWRTDLEQVDDICIIGVSV